MKRTLILLAALLPLGSFSYAQTTTTYSGTVRDLTQAPVTSGQVNFDLKPGTDTTMSGVARFTPATVTCSITASGALKANDGVNPCVVTNNTALLPSGTYYRICIQPYFAVPGACFNDYALGTAKDISTIVPTPGTAPAQTFVDTMTTQTISGNKSFIGSVSFSTITSPATWASLQTFSAGITGSGNTGTLTAGSGIRNTGNSWGAAQTFTQPLISTIATGTAPLTVTSTTPVANLTTVPVTYNAAGTQQTGVHIVEDNVSLVSGNATVTLTGAAAFSTATSYTCTASTASVTGTGNAIAIERASASTVKLHSTSGTDAQPVFFVCVGS